MKVIDGLDGRPSKGVRQKSTAVSIGNFDGVHRGHKSIIKRLLVQAKEQGAVPTVVTFEPHPQQVLRGKAPAKLVSRDKKLKLLESAGIGQVIVLHFNKQMSLVEPEQFITEVLLGSLSAKAIVVGSNFRFGHMARGDVSMLRSFGRKNGYSFESVRVSQLAGRTVSSTEVRHALSEGDLGWANRALTRSHSVEGVVVKGSKRGRKLGYPTANIGIDPELCLPRVGIYAGRVLAGRRRHVASISIGTNPTFGSNPVSVEAYLLDFDDDLYGQPVEAEFTHRLRDEKKFSSAGALEKAIAEDVERTRTLVR